MRCRFVDSVDLTILMKKIEEKEHKRRQKKLDKMMKKRPSFIKALLGWRI